MKTLRSQSRVRRIIEENGAFLVAFVMHDGLFTVPPDSPDVAAMRARILQAQRENAEVSFEYDSDLNIVGLL